jgi:putative membrane protein
VRPAFAHGLDPGSPAAAHLGWTIEPWIVLPLLLVAALHLAGSRHLRPSSPAGRRSFRARALLFWLGWATLALALVSPLHRAADHLFSLHMVEHELLMVVAAPLLVAARPGAVLLWGLPRAARRRTAVALRHPLARMSWRGAGELWSATALHALALWAWHLPGLFLAAAAHEGIHALQHASFFASAFLFWHAALRPQARGPAALALFATSLHAGLLGSLLAFSRVLWYPEAPDPYPLAGLTRAEDQALAGLVMWIPACSVYALAAVLLVGRWLARPGAARHA